MGGRRRRARPPRQRNPFSADQLERIAVALPFSPFFYTYNKSAASHFVSSIFISFIPQEMESESELVPFPLLPTPIETNYRACTIPYRFPTDNPKRPTRTEIAWLDLFLNSIPSFKSVIFFFFLFILSLFFNLNICPLTRLFVAGSELRVIPLCLMLTSELRNLLKGSFFISNFYIFV